VSRNGTALNKGGEASFFDAILLPLTFNQPCLRWLKRGLHLGMFALLPLLLAATPAAPPPRPTRVATAMVQIIRLEPVITEPEPKDVQPTDRQYRKRDTMPLTEFF
jgi:hypothetical protein